MAESLKRLRSSVVDGRAQTPRYIQRQLSKLHEALLKNQQLLHDAIRREADHSKAEADAEIYATVKAVKECYESIHLDKSLEQEYSLAKAKDNLSRRVAVGMAYIIPAKHSRLYSVIQPISAAIAAGNCVMIELGQTTSDVTSLLRKILSDTLDKDTFQIVDSKPKDPDFFSRRVVVIDGGLEPASHEAFSVLSSPPSRSVAVVDRSSDVASAAQNIIRARFAFKGRSPYSPDLVLVNEFVLQEFCKAASRVITDLIGGNLPNGNSNPSKSNGTLPKDLSQSGGTTLISGSRGSIVLVQERKSSLLSKKMSEPVLIIHPIRSLDDAIDLANLK